MSISTYRQGFFAHLGYFVKMNKKKILLGTGITAAILVILSLVSTFSLGSWTAGILDAIGSMLDTIVNTGEPSKIIEIMEKGRSVDYSFVGRIRDTIQGAAAALVVVLWAPTLLQAGLNQQAYDEIVIKKFIVLGVALLLIYNAEAICNGIVDIGTALASDLDTSDLNAGAGAANRSSTVNMVLGVFERKLEAITNGDTSYTDAEGNTVELENTDEEYESTVETDEDTGKSVLGIIDFGKNLQKIKNEIRRKLSAFGIVLKFWGSLIFPWIISGAARVMITIACYMRAVEIAILTMLSPIPFALVSNEPLGTGPGARFFKNLAALALQGAVMIIIAKVCSGLILEPLQAAVNAIGTDAAKTHLMDMSAIALCEGVLMLRSLSFSQKALGLQ